MYTVRRKTPKQTFCHNSSHIDRFSRLFSLQTRQEIRNSVTNIEPTIPQTRRYATL